MCFWKFHVGGSPRPPSLAVDGKMKVGFKEGYGPASLILKT